MQLFGIDLFTFRQPAIPMYDFARFGLVNADRFHNFAVMDSMVTQGNSATISYKSHSKQKENKRDMTPKMLFAIKALNDNEFHINLHPTYIADNIALIDKKLALMAKPRSKKPVRSGEPTIELQTGGEMYGREELESIKERLQNRRKAKNWQLMIDKYPHTTNARIQRVVELHNHLRCAPVGSFIPDMPKPAIKAMEEYKDMCVKLCNKTPIFYVIAKSEDFQKVNKRRDPILLAQSPFGFFWQILGAWDEEMMYLAEL